MNPIFKMLQTECLFIRHFHKSSGNSYQHKKDSRTCWGAYVTGGMS